MLHWFYELGFNVGVPVLVKCEKGKLIIMANTAMVQLKESEKASVKERKSSQNRGVDTKNRLT